MKKVEITPFSAYERHIDLKIMKEVKGYLTSYIKYKEPEFKTFGDYDLKRAVELLEIRISERIKNDSFIKT